MMDCLPQIHLAALHSESGFRSAVPGLGVLCRSPGDMLIGAGGYQNSLGRGSVYLAAGKEPWVFGGVKAGFIGGVVTGYRDSAVPMLAGFASYKQVHLTLIPKVPGLTPWTLGLSFTIQ